MTIRLTISQIRIRQSKCIGVSRLGRRCSIPASTTRSMMYRRNSLPLAFPSHDYHAPGGSTRMTNGAAGVLFYNKTILAETSAGSSANVHWRNNLILGENSAPAILSVNTNTNYSSSDYNGFRPNPGAEFSFQWNSPPMGHFSGL